MRIILPDIQPFSDKTTFIILYYTIIILNNNNALLTNIYISQINVAKVTKVFLLVRISWNICNFILDGSSKHL